MTHLLLTLNILLGADAATTHGILSRGGREVLLPTQNVWAIDGIVAAEGVGMSYGLSKLAVEHPKLAKGLTWTLIGVRGAIVASNLRQLGK
jgi:hypothetical protein